ncbi:MAG TPA: PIG-L family deacetylase [Phycisphaerae bacterium]|nr:PIG-L family deacetylase [Phycisphaerae bacterium]HNU45466.1 PIG-L family deacetylase [Phycisphaerae bacterium]
MATVLVLAPHPDDEVLGVGGTILRHLAEGDAVHVAICTRGEEARFGREQVERVQAEAREAHALLGVTGSHFLALPAARLDTLPVADVNAALSEVFERVRPEVLYVPHVGDVHRDHQVIFQAALVCSRPTGGRYPRRILAFETVSETDWYAAPLTPAFVPNVFVDISAHLDGKLAACAKYASQLRPAPDQRSLEAIRALSITRGSAMGLRHAEAFMLIRQID